MNTDPIETYIARLLSCRSWTEIGPIIADATKDINITKYHFSRLMEHINKVLISI